MKHLPLQVDSQNGIQPLDFPVGRVYNLGYTLRDPVKMQAHLDEIRKEGIEVPPVNNPPAFFPISAWATVTDREVPVQCATTSGEIEIVTLLADTTLYVGVGSDHTDRALEAINIPWSKQVAPNVLAPVVWPWLDVAGHWDAVRLECYVVEEGQERLYQQTTVAEFWTPMEMCAAVQERTVAAHGGLILFCGTVVSTNRQLSYARDWTIRMIDPVRDKQIEHHYHVVVLDDEIRV